MKPPFFRTRIAVPFFCPKHPLIRPDLAKVERAEAMLDIDALLTEAIASTELVAID